MKKLLILALMACLVFGGASASDEDVDLGGRTITVAVENAYPPYNYLDEAGNPIGWDYDVINYICGQINCVAEFIETSWDGMIVAVSNGEFDMAADGITITEERKELVDYSRGYVATDQVLLGRIDEERYTDGASLAAATDLVIGVQPGTTNYTVAIDLVGEGRVVAYDTFAIAVQALIAGDVDAVVMDDVAGMGYAGENAESVKLIGTPLVPSDMLGFIFPKGSDLVHAIDSALEQMEADRTLAYFNAKWITATGLPDLGGRTVTVAVENAYPPYNYLDESGNPIGWDYDVINDICGRLNCVPEYIETSWDGMIVAVSNGEFDMAADGITITDERKELVDYSVGYVATDQVLLVRLDEARFASGEELVADTALVVGVQPGTTNYTVAVELVGESRVVAYDTFAIAVQALIAGDVDAVIMDDVAGAGYAGENSESVKIVGDPLVPTDELGFIYPKGSELVEAFNLAFAEMRIDGSLKAYNDFWILGLTE
ncbi:MAG: amino acid ABC transporter substrate-binding protein [Chloroflexi bacterium]|nr:amino acid ABC transporter substrate-binding protein [Chloroflexota bacterium]